MKSRKSSSDESFREDQVAGGFDLLGGFLACFRSYLRLIEVCTCASSELETRK